MNLDQYSNLYNYLKSETIPTDFTDYQRKQLQTQAKYFEILNGLLYKRNRKNPSKPFRVIKWPEVDSVLYMMHSHPTAGHLGIDAMYHKIAERYYWDQMYRDIKEYVKTCEQCQRQGKSRRKEPLHPIKIGQAFERIGIDLVGPLPITTLKNRYIIVATDYLTRWPEAQAVPNASAATLAQFIFTEIVCRHGIPKIILSDQGPNFRSDMLRILCEKLLIHHKFSSPYHPQTNGMVERLNRTLCESLAKVATSQNWDVYLPPVLFTYRTKKHATTGYTPFQLVYGRQAVLPIEAILSTTETESEIDLEDSILTRAYELMDKLEETHEHARKNTETSQQKQKQRHDARIKPVGFEIGEKVWVQRKDIESSRSVKFEDKRKGPYTICAKLGNGAYKLRNDKGQILKRYYNSDRLEKYYERQNWEPQVVIETTINQDL